MCREVTDQLKLREKVKQHARMEEETDNFRMNTGMVDTVPLIIWLL
jgi:hypothetical protein